MSFSVIESILKYCGPHQFRNKTNTIRDGYFQPASSPQFAIHPPPLPPPSVSVSPLKLLSPLRPGLDNVVLACSYTLWNASPQVVRSTEWVLLERMNGAHIVQGCNGRFRWLYGDKE